MVTTSRQCKQLGQRCAILPRAHKAILVPQVIMTLVQGWPTWQRDKQAFFNNRFDGVGNSISKMNPILKRITSTSDMLIQILLASASGDTPFLKRFRKWKCQWKTRTDIIFIQWQVLPAGFWLNNGWLRWKDSTALGSCWGPLCNREVLVASGQGLSWPKRQVDELTESYVKEQSKVKSMLAI